MMKKLSTPTAYIVVSLAVAALFFLAPQHVLAVDVTSKGQGDIKANGSTQSTWTFNLPPNWYQCESRVQFDDDPMGAWKKGNPGKKGSDGTTTAVSPIEYDPDKSGGYGYGSVRVTTDAGYTWHSHKYKVTARADAKPQHSTKTEAEYVDPTSLAIGDAGTELSFTHDLSAGTQIQEPNVNDPDGPPVMILRGRFGKGLFNPGGGSPLPEVFWADPMPDGAMDLYRIEVYENSFGSIEANATLFTSTDPDFDMVFTMTEAELEAAIETSGWSKGSDGIWELSFDIALIDVTITNLNSANLGERAAIGCCAAISAFDEGCLDGLTFDVDALIADQTSTIVITGAAPYDTVIIGYSFNGGGPFNMIWGTVYLTPPIRKFPWYSADGYGNLVVTVPCPHLPGLQIWFQCLDLQAGELSNGWNGAISDGGGDYRYDDGCTETLLGWTDGGDLCWMHRFDAVPGGDTITNVQTIWGSAKYPGYGPGNGTIAYLYVWEDPTDDGNPNDCVLLTQETVTVRNEDTDIMNYYALTTPVCVSGEFYVGAVLSHIPGEYVIPLDESTPYTAGNAFYTGTNSMGGFNPYNLMANQYPPADYGTYWCLRAGY